MHNLAKLTEELRSAGLPVRGVNSEPESESAAKLSISWDEKPTQAQEDSAWAIVDAHDPTPTIRQRIAAIGITPREAALIKKLRKGAAAPAWVDAILTEAEMEIDRA